MSLFAINYEADTLFQPTVDTEMFFQKVLKRIVSSALCEAGRYCRCYGLRTGSRNIPAGISPVHERRNVREGASFYSMFHRK
jgi:hypothetical protein